MAWTRPKPEPWALEPQETERPEFWKGMTVIPFWEGKGFPKPLGGKVRNIINLNNIEGTDWAWVNGPVGRGIKYITTGAKAQGTLVSLESQILTSLKGGTILMVRIPSDTTNRQSSYGSSAAVAANRFQTNCPWSDGVVYFDFGGTTNGTTRTQWSGYTKSTSTLDIFAFVAGQKGMSIWHNGIKRASHATAASRSQGATGFFFNNAGGGVNDLHTMYFWGATDQEWTDAQVREWMADPFAMLRPRQRLLLRVATQPAADETTTTNTLTASLDSLLQKTVTSAVSLDSLIFKSGESASTSLDALLFKSGITSTTSLDGLLFKSGVTTTASLDARLIESANTVTTTLSLDAELLKTFSAGTSLDGLLFKSGVTKTASLDGVLSLEVTATSTPTISMDAHLQGEFSAFQKTVSLSAHLFTWRSSPAVSQTTWDPLTEVLP